MKVFEDIVTVVDFRKVTAFDDHKKLEEDARGRVDLSGKKDDG